MKGKGHIIYFISYVLEHHHLLRVIGYILLHMLDGGFLLNFLFEDILEEVLILF